MIWKTLQTIAYSIMVHARFSDEYMHFAIIHKTNHVFPGLPIKHFVNQDGEINTPHKLETGETPSVSKICGFFTCFVRKSTSHVDTKALNMHHQSQKGFQGILVEILQHQKGYLI